jgi:GTP-binding protein HflX
MALNKIDRLPEGSDLIDTLDTGVTGIPISALNGRNIETLLMAIEAVMERYLQSIHVFLPYERGDLMSLFYERGQVEEERHEAEGVSLLGRLPDRLLPYFEPYVIAEEGAS